MTEALNRAPVVIRPEGSGCARLRALTLQRRRLESSISAHAILQAGRFKFPRSQMSVDIVMSRAPLMAFGRYAGQPLDAIPTDYLVWLVKTMPNAPIAAWVRGELFMRGLDPSDDT